MRPAHPGPFSLFPPRARGIQLPPPYLLKLKVRDIPDQKYIQLYSHTPYLAVAKLIFVVFFWASPPFPGWGDGSYISGDSGGGFSRSTTASGFASVGFGEFGLDPIR